MRRDLHGEHLIETATETWREKSLAGLSEIRLWEDPSGASISLVRFRRGAGIPERHLHASNQFMYCLQGVYEYTESGLVLRPGTFYHNEKGHEHGPTVAREDTVVLEIYDGPHYPFKPGYYGNEEDAR